MADSFFTVIVLCITQGDSIATALAWAATPASGLHPDMQQLVSSAVAASQNPPTGVLCVSSDMHLFVHVYTCKSLCVRVCRSVRASLSHKNKLLLPVRYALYLLRWCFLRCNCTSTPASVCLSALHKLWSGGRPAQGRDC